MMSILMGMMGAWGLVLGWFWVDRWQFERKKRVMTTSIQSKFLLYIQSLEEIDGLMHAMYTAIPELEDTQNEESYGTA